MRLNALIEWASVRDLVFERPSVGDGLGNQGRCEGVLWLTGGVRRVTLLIICI
jgi:hypothetical protein